MGTSHPEGKAWIIKKLAKANIKTVLDVGAGEGTYVDLLKPVFPKALFIGVEAWPPYVFRFNLNKKYNLLIVERVQDIATIRKLDLVIFGDVLEHMTREEAITLYFRFKEFTRYIVISLPIVKYPQGAVNGNPYEKHVVPDWTHEQVLKSFTGITASFKGEKKGCYIARGGRFS